MITLTYVYACDGCGYQYKHVEPLEIDMRPLHPWTPESWCRVNEKLYCPKHKVTIKVDETVTHLAHGKVNIA